MLLTINCNAFEEQKHCFSNPNSTAFETTFLRALKEINQAPLRAFCVGRAERVLPLTRRVNRGLSTGLQRFSFFRALFLEFFFFL